VCVCVSMVAKRERKEEGKGKAVIIREGEISGCFFFQSVCECRSLRVSSYLVCELC
jgi:hypothetical protein